MSGPGEAAGQERAEGRTPAPAHLAASLILLQDAPDLRVLMIERHAQAHFGAALVFPGGLVCTDDRSPAWLPHVIAGGLADEQRALRIAGWREVHEETGLAPVPLAAEAASYLEKVRGSGARLDLTALQPFAHWITPAFMPKRFDTHFYACRFEGDAPPVCDGREAVEALWISPAEALALGAARRRKLMLPTRANLQRLLPHRTAGEALAAAAAQPVVAVQPRREVRPDGVFLVIPPDAGYAETQEPLQD